MQMQCLIRNNHKNQSISGELIKPETKLTFNNQIVFTWKKLLFRTIFPMICVTKFQNFKYQCQNKQSFLELSHD